MVRLALSASYTRPALTPPPPWPWVVVVAVQNEGLLADPQRLRQISERIPANRWGAPADFSGPAVFLASMASQYVSGETLVVDGGWMGR